MTYRATAQHFVPLPFPSAVPRIPFPANLTASSIAARMLDASADALPRDVERGPVIGRRPRERQTRA